MKVVGRWLELGSWDKVELQQSLDIFAQLVEDIRLLVFFQSCHCIHSFYPSLLLLQLGDNACCQSGQLHIDKDLSDELSDFQLKFHVKTRNETKMARKLKF